MKKCLALLAAAFGLAACQGPSVDEVAQNDVLTANGLTSNGLTSNGLTSNGLTSNGLTSNGLAAGKLSSPSMAALRDKTATGDTTRMFFRYLISCALPAGHNVSYTWTDSANVVHSETATGAFNLAPGWENGSADTAAQEWVSACLFARTNTMGISVPISVRGEGVSTLAATPQERIDYPYGEGAFWGNLFTSSPFGRSCSRSPMKTGATTSADLHNGRTCASQGCGIVQYVGPCYTYDFAVLGQACFQRASNNDWVASCNYSMTSLQPTTTHVISTWLRP